MTLPTNVPRVKGMVFPVVMYGCESWTIKNAKCQITDAFKSWYWSRLLRVSCTARIESQSILKEINPEYSLKGLRLKLKFQNFGQLMQRADSLEKTLMLGNIEGKRRRGWQRMRWLDSIIDSTDMNLSQLQEIAADRGAWHATVPGVGKGQTWLSDWTATTKGKGRVLLNTPWDLFLLLNSWVIWEGEGSSTLPLLLILLSQVSIVCGALRLSCCSESRRH